MLALSLAAVAALRPPVPRGARSFAPRAEPVDAAAVETWIRRRADPEELAAVIAAAAAARAVSHVSLGDVEAWIEARASDEDLEAVVAAATAVLGRPAEPPPPPGAAVSGPDEAEARGVFDFFDRAPAEVREALRAPLPVPPEDAGPDACGYEFVLRFDGGSRGNPGLAGAGAFLTRDGAAVWAGWHPFDDPSTTNNVAEYGALLLGLEALGQLGVSRCHVIGDSKLVINQVNGDWRCRDPRMAALRARAVALARSALTGGFAFSHVRRESNGHADALANYAMDSGAAGSVGSIGPQEWSPNGPAAAGGRPGIGAGGSPR